LQYIRKRKLYATRIEISLRQRATQYLVRNKISLRNNRYIVSIFIIDRIPFLCHHISLLIKVYVETCC